MTATHFPDEKISHKVSQVPPEGDVTHEELGSLIPQFILTQGKKKHKSHEKWLLAQ